MNVVGPGGLQEFGSIIIGFSIGAYLPVTEGALQRDRGFFARRRNLDIFQMSEKTDEIFCFRFTFLNSSSLFTVSDMVFSFISTV